MAKNQARFVIDASESKPSPLTLAEKAAIKQGEEDIKAGRVYDHDDVAVRLRKRAAEIAERVRKPR